MIQLTGEYTTAHIFLDPEDIEENTLNQIQTMIDSPAISNPVAVMPDCHVGKGSVIGFTMPLSEKVIPNIVGVDIGCGLIAVKLGHLENPNFERIDAEIRENIPIKNNVYEGEDGYHLVKEFPEEKAMNRLTQFSKNNQFDLRTYNDFTEYGEKYFKDLCNRLDYDTNRAINSLGTLGGGNHFIEIGQSTKTNEYWCIIHSGSRGIGNRIATYWQQKADAKHDDRTDRIREQLEEYPSEYFKFDLSTITDENLIEYCQGGKGEDWKNMDTIKSEFIETNPEKIQEIQEELAEIGKIAHEDQNSNPLNYLEGENAKGYLIDMIFAQIYASLSRKKMAHKVADIVGTTVKEEIESVHNFIDFRDGIIRKGATRAYKGEKSIVPFNMKDGTIIVEGKSNPEWNYSVCHGAGRVMSRTKSRKTLDMETYKEQMKNIFTTSISEHTLEEAPQAYKETLLIKNAIEPTAEIKNTIKPVYNLKAENTPY